jgi:hypothetical protein
MVAEVFGGISALKAALDILKTIKDANDVATRQGIVIKLQEQILSVHTAQLELIEEVGALKAQVAKSETWEADKQQYELKRLGPNSLAYMLKREARRAKPPHWICTRCFGDRYAEIIQHISGFGFRCPRCHMEIDPSSAVFDSSGPKWLD